jgi:hypothetical protein
VDAPITDGMLVAALLTIATLATSTVAFAVAWIRARERARLVERAPGGSLGEAAASRFDRLDQAVEAIAVEVERVSEAERFQSRLMAARAGAIAAPVERASDAGRVVTPH